METSATVKTDIALAQQFVDQLIKSTEYAVRSHASEIVRYSKALEDGLAKGDIYKVSAYLHAIAQQIQSGVKSATKWDSLTDVQRELETYFGFNFGDR